MHRIAVQLGVLVLVCGCGARPRAVSGAGQASRCPPRVQVSSRLVAREAALYRGAEVKVLRCTLQRNADSGLSWLRAATGEDRSGQALGAQLPWIQAAIRGAAELPEGTLADVGWYLGEQVRRACGGSFGWSEASEQPAVMGPGGEVVLLPLEVVARAQRCDVELEAALGDRATGRPGTAAPAACGPDMHINVVRARLRR